MMFVVGNCGAHLSLVLLVVATYIPLSTIGQQSSSLGTYRLGLGQCIDLLIYSKKPFNRPQSKSLLYPHSWCLSKIA